MKDKINKRKVFFDFIHNHTCSECLLIPFFDLAHNIVAILLIGTKSEEILSIETILKSFSLKLNQNQYHLQIQEDTNDIMEAIPYNALLLDNYYNIINANSRCTNRVALSKQQLSGLNLSSLFDDIVFSEDLNNFSSKPTHISIKNQIVVPCTIIKHKEFSQSGGIMLIFKAENTTLSLPILSSEAEQDSAFYKFVGEAFEIDRIKDQAKKIANTPSNIIIQGESGTGKELLAEAIHLQSRRQGPFIAVNCGAIPKELLQSELFGYDGGTFTGGHKRGKVGKLEAANGGTIFFDEIGEMPADMQVTLLRFLQDRVVVRLGSTIGNNVDVRVIAATNRNLHQETLNGNFREDLYYRLNVFKFVIPPLRHRKEDIPLLVKHMVEVLCKEHNLNKPVIRPEVINILLSYDWPGNARELHNIIEVLLYSCQDDLITTDLLPRELLDPTASAGVLAHNGTLKDYEQEIIMSTLQKSKDNLTRTAASLGINRKTLYNKLKAFNIEIGKNSRTSSDQLSPK